MLRRFLLIGVGGSGGKTLRYLHRELRHRLDEVGWTEDIPAAWQFLWIDVPSSPDGNEPPLPPQLPDGCYVGLAQSPLTYSTLDNSLLGSASTRLLQECAGWRPNPDHVKIAIGAGAGQHRTLGRVIALANLTKIRGALGSVHDKLTAPQATVQLARLNRLLGNDDDNDTPDPVVAVVSSLAGGAGAGMYLDVCNVVRAELPWTDNLIALLFAPDVFEEISALGATGVQPNGLAALSELLAGYWNNEPPGDTEFALYEPAGIPMGGVRGRGPKYPFIIGRSNSYVNFGSQLDVYAGTASALAAILTSEAAQANLVSYTLGNWAARAGTLPDTLGLKTEMDHTPLSSLGFASVSLGRDRFGRYAAERLARMSAEHLLRAHWVGRDVPTKTKPDVALEEGRAQSFEWFLRASGLNELGETANDILDALAAPGAEATIDEAINDVKAQVAQHAQGVGLKPEQWAEAMRSRLDVKEPTLLANLRAASEELARSDWVPAVQRRIVNLTAEALAREGAPVTVALLRSLQAELGEVIVELGHEEELRRRWVSHRDSAIQSELANAAAGAAKGAGVIPATSEFITRAYEKVRRTIVWAAEADLRAFAADVTRDLRENLLAPLEQAVADGLAVLARDDSPPAGQPASPLRDWPEGNLLPRRFEPAVNERLIEPAGDYPQVFERQILTTIGGTTAVDATRQAVRQVVLGAATPDDQTVLRITGFWQPARLATASSPPAKAHFEIRLEADDLLARAKAWVHQPDTAIGEHVSETLRRYLDPDAVSPAELSARTQRFQGAFTEALSLAAPLVSINPEVLQQTHGLAQAQSSYSFTEIPLPEGTPGRQAVESVMRARGLNPGSPAIQRVFGTGDQAEIDILSTLDAPFEPVAFDSIMGPIAADWTARQGSVETRKHFWKWRRSRPLTHFVPMAPSVRRSFIRGWFVARSLGQLRWTNDTEPVTAWVPEERRWIAFPFPLIGTVSATMDFLPAVLESLPLALVAAGTKGQGGATALLPFKRLRQLGDDVSVALRPWITAGAVDAHAPAPMEDMGTAADEPAIRRKKVVEYFANLQTIYAKQIDVRIDQFNFYTIRWVWELRDDIRPILEELVSIATQTEAIEDERV